MTSKQLDGIKKKLAKRLVEVGKMRDKIRGDMEEYEALAENCDSAYDNIEAALDSLSQLT